MKINKITPNFVPRFNKNIKFSGCKDNNSVNTDTFQKTKPNDETILYDINSPEYINTVKNMQNVFSLASNMYRGSKETLDIANDLLYKAWDNRRFFGSDYKDFKTMLYDVHFEEADHNNCFMQIYNNILGKYSIVQFDPYFDGKDWPQVSRIYKYVESNEENQLNVYELFNYEKIPENLSSIPSSALAEATIGDFRTSVEPLDIKAEEKIDFLNGMDFIRIHSNYNKSDDLEYSEQIIEYENGKVTKAISDCLTGPHINKNTFSIRFDDKKGIVIIK